MKDHAGLPDLAEMQTSPNDQIEKIVRRESAIVRRFDVIAGDEMFLLSVRREERRLFGVIGSTGQELQSEKRMGGAAFAQVDLDRVSFPCGAARSRA